MGVGHLEEMEASRGTHPFRSRASTSSTRRPKMKRFSAPASSAISTLAPSMVPMVRAPLSMNFMLPVPEASVPAVEICCDRSAAGMTAGSGARARPVSQEAHEQQQRQGDTVRCAPTHTALLPDPQPEAAGPHGDAEKPCSGRGPLF